MQFSPTSDFPEIDLASQAFRAPYFHLIDGERWWFITILKWSRRFYVLCEREQPFLSVLSAFIYETGGNDASGQNRGLSRTKRATSTVSTAFNIFLRLSPPFAASQVSIYSVSYDFLWITTRAGDRESGLSEESKKKIYRLLCAALIYTAMIPNRVRKVVEIEPCCIDLRRRIRSTRQNFELVETKNTRLGHFRDQRLTRQTYSRM